MSNLPKDLKKFIIAWNNQFPLDKWWRDKYKVPFGSQDHLDANQIDIMLEYMEENVFTDRNLQVLEEVKKKALLDKGEWLSENDEVSDELFDKIAF